MPRLTRPLLVLCGLLLVACPLRRGGDDSDRVEGTRAGDCTDDADNDGDGFFDCEDQGCWGSPDCPDTGDDDDAVDDDDTVDDDDDATTDDDDDTVDDDDATTDDDDATTDDDDTVDDDDATTDDDDDATEPPLPIGTCAPVAVIGCGDVVNADTSLPGIDDVMDGYPCTTSNESGPELVYELDLPASTDVELYLTAFGVWELDLLLLEETGSGCRAADCIQYDNYYQQFTTAPGVTYYVAVDGFSGWAGAFGLEVTCLACVN